MFRINRRTFDLLLYQLIEYRLEAERTLTIAEKVLYFLYIIRQGSGYRTVRALFRRPLGTISDSFYTIIAALLSIYLEVVRELEYNTVPERITKNPKFYLYFKDCVGALNSSYIKAYVVRETKLYRNRKGNLS